VFGSGVVERWTRAANMRVQTVPHELHELGYRSQVCVDFSEIVVEQMKEKYMQDEGIEWQCADVRALPLEDQTVDVAFDKGTLDAMIFGSPWDPPDQVKENTSKYINEVRPCVSLGMLANLPWGRSVECLELMACFST